MQLDTRRRVCLPELTDGTICVPPARAMPSSAPTSGSRAAGSAAAPGVGPTLEVPINSPDGLAG